MEKVKKKWAVTLRYNRFFFLQSHVRRRLGFRLYRKADSVLFTLVAFYYR